MGYRSVRYRRPTAGLEEADRAALMATLKSETQSRHVSEDGAPIAHWLLHGQPAESLAAQSDGQYRPT